MINVPNTFTTIEAIQYPRRDSTFTPINVPSDLGHSLSCCHEEAESSPGTSIQFSQSFQTLNSFPIPLIML
jgi:hypothetical protein